MAYQWNEQKRRINLRRHRLDFRDAHLAFNSDAIVLVDDRYDYDEERYILYGFAGEQLIAIAFTYRGESVHIISMRKATRMESAEYVQNRLGKAKGDEG